MDFFYLQVLKNIPKKNINEFNLIFKYVSLDSNVEKNQLIDSQNIIIIY